VAIADLADHLLAQGQMAIPRVGAVLERAAQRTAGLFGAQAVCLGSRQPDAGPALEARRRTEAAVPLRVEARQQVAAVAVGAAVVVRGRRRTHGLLEHAGPARRAVAVDD
jgi:hypothetical protein